ncbi:twenty s rrna accumulation protein tsr1p [Vairimorpha apis BRL 01]|uniref:Twenty s rrna accumulation protein tsr1p n=1 Tax=Vairimorpha apis BRL 01 TaxID=1037528 RepID=T0LD78_9MICR|nr:twenty s rrna accumulation protein tsr1p [Vairimorpha apis BRL 01]
MKIKDKRNRNKQVNENKVKKIHEEQKLYSSEYGPYKVVTFVNLGGNIDEIKCNLLQNKQNNHFFYKNKSTNFLFFDTDNLNDYEMSFIARASDFVVFLINILDNKYKNEAKLFVKQEIPEQKIVGIYNMLDYLSFYQIKNTNLCFRPYMIPLSIQLSDNHLIVKGFMKKGLVSNNVIINGKYNGYVVSVNGENINLGISDDEKIQFTTINNFNDNEMEILDDSNEEIYESESCSDNFEEDFEESKYPSLIEKYSEYRDNQIVELKLKIENLGNDKIFVLFNYYEFEEYNTIHNFAFSCDTIIKSHEKKFVDFGYKLVEVNPVITKNANQNLFKIEEGLSDGVFSFIGPLSFNLHKIMIFDENCLMDISRCTFRCLGVNLGIKERKLYNEVVLKGLPIKIFKRSCVVKRMFYSKEEVQYFKNIRLYTKKGRASGFIKKPLGVHGAFKAFFSQPILSNDKIFMSLYKREFLEN